MILTSTEDLSTELLLALRDNYISIFFPVTSFGNGDCYCRNRRSYLLIKELS